MLTGRTICCTPMGHEHSRVEKFNFRACDMPASLELDRVYRMHCLDLVRAVPETRHEP